MRKFLQLFYLLVLICKADTSLAQVPTLSSSDSFRIIQILFANNIRQIRIDSATTIETLAGNVRLQEAGTKFTCDSAVLNRRLNTLEAFGNVRINQGDTLFTFSQYIKYLGNERVALLRRNVKLTDRRATLLAPEMEYNLTTGVGKYYKGGKVINGKTTLTSTEGIYYSDTKDVYFINKVDVVDPKMKIKADSLLYNMQTQKLNFIGPTYIKSSNGNIFTTTGNYDLNTGAAFFGNRTLVKDSSGRTYQANNMAMDDKTGQAQLEGNAIIKDSANRLIVTGNQIFLSRKNNSFLATKKPVLIVWQDKDTTYIAADTLFSGYTKKVSGDIIPQDDSVTQVVGAKDTTKVNTNDSTQKSATIKRDSTKPEVVRKSKNINLKNKADTSIRYFIAYRHVRIFNDSLQSVSDSLFYSGADSTFRLFYDPVIWSGKNQVTGDTIYLFTKNKKAERVYVFENGMMINKIKGEFYNQISGKTINGYFRSGAIDYIKVKGSPAESIYYVQDKDSAFSGMNHADGSVIDMYFIKQQLNTVKFLNDVHGKLYPIRQIPQDKKYLKGFNWLDKRRPKNKLELFE